MKEGRFAFIIRSRSIRFFSLLPACQSGNDYFGSSTYCNYYPGGPFSSGSYSCYTYSTNAVDPNRAPLQYANRQSGGARGSATSLEYMLRIELKPLDIPRSPIGSPLNCISQAEIYRSPLAGLTDQTEGAGDTWCHHGRQLRNGASLSNTVGVELANPCEGGGSPLPSCGGPVSQTFSSE